MNRRNPVSPLNQAARDRAACSLLSSAVDSDSACDEASRQYNAQPVGLIRNPLCGLTNVVTREEGLEMQADEDESENKAHAKRLPGESSETAPRLAAETDGDEFFAQRTQVLTTADLANIGDPDHRAQAVDTGDSGLVDSEPEVEHQIREDRVTASENFSESFSDDAEVRAADRNKMKSSDELPDSLDSDSDSTSTSSDPGPGRAHDCLEIRTPVEEFETYVRARIETLTRLGERDQVDLMLRALDLGKRKLARISGAPTP